MKDDTMNIKDGVLDLRHSSLLVIDTDSNNMHTINAILKKCTYDVTYVNSGEKALETLQRTVPDLILLNESIANTNGFEICKRIREEDQRKDIPILVVTEQLEGKERMEEGFIYGVSDLLIKPFDSNELVTKVTTHLQNKKYKDYLKKLSPVDPLTNLLNKNSMIEKILDEEIRARRSNLSYSLILCRLENIQGLEHSFGQETVKNTLKSVAAMLAQGTREQDTISRWSETEFLLLLPNTDRQGGKTLAEKLRQAIESAAYGGSSREISITATVGIATCKGEKSYEACIKQAIQALSRAVKKGRNCVVHFNDRAEV